MRCGMHDPAVQDHLPIDRMLVWFRWVKLAERGIRFRLAVHPHQCAQMPQAAFDLHQSRPARAAELQRSARDQLEHRLRITG